MAGLTCETTEKRIISDQPEHRKVEIRAVEEKFLKVVQSEAAKNLLGKILKEDGVIDVQQWLEPNTTLILGLDIPKFIIDFVENHLPLFLEDELNEDEIKLKVGKKYSVLVTTISLLEFAEIPKLKQFLVDLKAWSDNKF